MDIKIIEKIAKETGMDMCMFENPKLTDMGDGTSKFISSGKLTYYGAKLIKFANTIEAHINSL